MKCPYCDEEITAQDETQCYSNGVAEHRECFLRQIFGSVAHQEKRCSCFSPGSDSSDPAGMTKREAAKAAVDLYYEKREA